MVDMLDEKDDWENSDIACCYSSSESDDKPIITKKNEEQKRTHESFDDSTSVKSEESSDWEGSMQIIGQKYGLTKTSVKGTYDFQFLQDEKFLAKSEEEKKKFIEI